MYNTTMCDMRQNEYRSIYRTAHWKVAGVYKGPLFKLILGLAVK